MPLAGLGILALVFALPFLWMALGSFLGSEAFSTAPTHAWPGSWNPGNYGTAWLSADLGHGMMVSLLVAGLTAAQDFLVEGALRGVGYKVQNIGMADTTAAVTTLRDAFTRAQHMPEGQRSQGTIAGLRKRLAGLGVTLPE